MEDECAATATSPPNQHGPFDGQPWASNGIPSHTTAIATAVSANSSASCTNTLGLSAPLATSGVAAGLADATSPEAWHGSL